MLAPAWAAGMLTTIIGIFTGIGMLAILLIWYPLKKLNRWIRSSKTK